MNREMKMWLAILSIAILASVLILLLASGFDISGIEIHTGIKLG